MRRRRGRPGARTKNRYKKLALCLAAVLCAGGLVKLMFLSLPYLSAAAEKAAVFSAALTMPEGGKHLLAEAVNAEPSLEETSSQAASSEAVSSEETSSAEASSAEISSAEASSAASSQVQQEKPADAGTIVRKTYTASASNIFLPLPGGAFVKNVTSLSADKVKEAMAAAPAFTLTKSDDPQVLIMHTHTTESYEPVTRDWYDKSYNSRTTDNSKNMVRVGDEIEKQLKAAGIGVLHDTTQHDYPSYTGSYERSAETVKGYLKKYPSIKVVLDVHRDAIQSSDGTRTAPVAKINGKNAAQVMIISGCDDGTMNYPNYFKNLSFACALQDQLEKDYKGLTRPLLFDYRKYNQDLTTGSILLEMGSNSNSLEEAVYTGELVGKSLAKVLQSLQK